MLGKNVVYNFISSMIEESIYCSEVMKKHFNKNLVIAKGANEDLNVGSVTMTVLIMMLKYQILVILLENIEALRIEIVISILN